MNGIAEWVSVIVASAVAGVILFTLVVPGHGDTVRRMFAGKPFPARRPRPDYPAIAAMEREVYGEIFGHDGAPKPESGSVAELHAMMDDLAERGTARRHIARECGCTMCGIPNDDDAHCRPCDERELKYRSNLHWERPS